ncbi:cupin domain-containing protein, partial [Psychrobacter sp. AOP42-A1-21]
SLQRLNAGEVVFDEDSISGVGGTELLVVAGSLIDDGQVYQRGSWIRLPVGEQSQIKAGLEGVTLYIKTGHLEQVIGL